MKKILISLAGLSLALMMATGAVAETAKVNGLEMYYEVHGEGEPLVLLHGGYMSNESNWSTLLPVLAETRKVIAVELQGHGRTPDREGPLSYEKMAADVAALLDQLKIGQAAVFGYSMGGAVAIRLAIDHPHKVSRLVAASGYMSYTEDVLGKPYFDMIASITPEFFTETPVWAEYSRLAPDPNHFPEFVAKLRALDLETFDWSDGFAQIEVPALYIFGDADIVGTDYAARMHKLGGGILNGDMNGVSRTQLLVLPGTSHTGVFFDPANIEIMKAVVPAFLEKELSSGAGPEG